jgi:hypothetical protein
VENVPFENTMLEIRDNDIRTGYVSLSLPIVISGKKGSLFIIKIKERYP